jgi:glycine cleavage system H lipoate-binding protein
MTIILVLLTLVVFIAIGLIKRSRTKAATTEETLPEAQPASIVLERYYHPGHSWALVSSSGEVTVGVDDFTQKVVGGLSKVQLPVLGSQVKQGEVYATLERGGKSLPQIAPLSGTIVGVNNKLASSPRVVNSSPLEKGWIVRLAPAHLTVELRNLFKGVIADRWQEAVNNQLVRWFASPLHPVLQDGGQIVDNVSDLMDDAEWQRFVQEFFSIEVTYRNNNLTNQRS